MRIFLVVLLLAIASCSSDPVIQVEYREVQVPVPYRSVPPTELATPYIPERLPVFLQPGQGVVSLDEQGVNDLKTILRTLITKDEAWRAWSSDDNP